MGSDERRRQYSAYIRAALARENPLLRRVTFTYTPSRGERTEVRLDGESPGALALEVRSYGLSPDQEQMLRDKGLVGSLDDDDPRYTLYRCEVPAASTDDLVTFVEWVYLCVLGVPDDYEATVAGPGRPARGEASPGKKGRPGCRSCLSAITIVFWIILGIAVLSYLFR